MLNKIAITNSERPTPKNMSEVVVEFSVGQDTRTLSGAGVSPSLAIRTERP
jgi:hypothetical protein